MFERLRSPFGLRTASGRKGFESRRDHSFRSQRAGEIHQLQSHLPAWHRIGIRCDRHDPVGIELAGIEQNPPDARVEVVVPVQQRNRDP